MKQIKNKKIAELHDKIKSVIKNTFCDYDEAFKSEILAENLFRLSVFAPIFAFVEILLSLFSIKNNITPLPNILFVVCNIIIIPILFIFKKKHMHSFVLNFILYFYISITVSVGLYLTFVRIGTTNSAYIYIMILVFIVACIFMTPLKSMIFLLVSYMVFYITASILIKDKAVVVLLVTNTLVFHFMGWILSFIIIRLKHANYEKTKLLNYLAITDRMTDLYNHENIYLQVCQGIGSDPNMRKEQASTTIAMIDIDDFKKINDLWGHQVGDDVLIKFAQILKDKTRPCDKVGRYGGEEFLLIFPNASKAEVEHIIKRIQLEVQNTKWHHGQPLTFSCGICEHSGENVNEFLMKADNALYYVKNNGKNGCHLS